MAEPFFLDPFPIVKIPHIMRKFGWFNGAALMETWFFRPAAIAPNYSQAVTDVIKMDWVLGFERAKKVYDQIFTEKAWTKVRIQRDIADWLNKDGYLNYFPGSQLFGDLKQSPEKLDEHYISKKAVYYSFGQIYLDDLLAALGAFTFHAVAAGTVTTQAEGTGQDITINEVGVFVIDSYDFEGEQNLGFWDEGSIGDWYHKARQMRVSSLPYDGTRLVTNYDFRRHRKKTNLGGDFRVYSDVKRVPVEPVTFNSYHIWDSKLND